MEILVKIRAGYDVAFQCPYAVPMVLMLATHPSRDGDILSEQSMLFSPGVEAPDFFDPYGNICTRLVAPPGLLEVRSDFLVDDSGRPDEVCPTAHRWDVGSLPGEILPFLLASRYCDTEKLSNLAWSLFGAIQGGWQRAQAICDWHTTASNSVIIMREAIAPPRRDTRNAAAFAGTSLILQ
jgi:hypothetical protein